MLPYLVVLLTLLFSTVVHSSSLEILVVTSAAENRQSAGKSFAGITVKPVSYTHLTLPTKA